MPGFDPSLAARVFGCDARACEDRRVNVQRICFLGTRTPSFDATSALFGDVLGLRNVQSEVGWSIFELPSGRSDFVEVFGPEYENASVFPAEVTEGIVVAFAVDDIAGARESW
jgi:catechol 2,3-dioxygenase-like lactoylglutathione lyase family enzyme